MSRNAVAAGFALIELIAVLAIMAIMAGAVAPLLLNNIDRSEAEKEHLALQAIGEGIKQYYLEPGPNMGTLPPAVGWDAALAGDYVGMIAANISANGRGNTRGYYTDIGAETGAGATYPNGVFSVIPKLTLYSHIDVATDAPTSITCVGEAGEYVDPCVSGDIDFNLRILNLNLGEQRQQIVDHVTNRYLTPVAEAFKLLPRDVCDAITDSTVGEYYVLDEVGPTAPAQDIGATVRTALGVYIDTSATDPWGQEIRVIKSGGNLFVWSGGPFGRTPNSTDDANAPWLPQSYPLVVSVQCQGGESLDETFARIKTAVIGYAAGTYDPETQPYVYLPENLSDATSSFSDPWNAAINYVPTGTFVTGTGYLGGGFTLTSYGPDSTTGGGNDVSFTVSQAEIRGELQKTGIPYPGVAEHLSVVKNAIIGYTLSAAGNLLPANQTSFESVVNLANGTVIADPISGNICYHANSNGAPPPDVVYESFELWTQDPGCEAYPGATYVDVSGAELSAVFSSAGQNFPRPAFSVCNTAAAALNSTLCVDDWESNAESCEDSLKVYRKCP